jgi:hypothetical protein
MLITPNSSGAIGYAGARNFRFGEVAASHGFIHDPVF